MSESGSEDKSDVVEVELVKQEEPESVELSMSEYSSLRIEVTAPNPKRVLYSQGLYEPGSGELCTAYTTLSDSAVFRHPYYSYPSVKDPGISKALLGPTPKLVYPDDGQDLYLELCKDMKQCPVRLFHKALLGTKADLSYYCINPNNVRAMTKAMFDNQTLAVINLTDNFLNDDACFHFGEMLMTNTTLEELNLSGCRIGVSGALRLCAGLPTNRALRALDLSRNQLGDAGVQHVANAVYSRADVRELNLASNSITGKGIQTLAEALEWNNKLTHLDLSRNDLYSTPSGIANLFLELGTSEELQYLNISWNFLSGKKVSGGINRVFCAKKLQHLDISNNKLGSLEVVTDLTTFMAKPKKMVTYDVSFNPIGIEEALLFIYKMRNEAVKVQVLYMEGISVNVEFTEILKSMKELTQKQNVVVTHGYVEGRIKAEGPDPREVVLDRVEFICMKPKKHKVDIALVVYQLVKDGYNDYELNEFGAAITRLGAALDDDLLAELLYLFPGPLSKKGTKKINLGKIAEYIKRKWPERKLPPTPPPEQEPLPVAKLDKKGAKAWKGNAGKK